MKWKYEIWFEHNCITLDREFDSEEEALDEAEITIGFYLDDWPDTTRDDYEVRTEEYERRCYAGF